jgi:hypothetical protein
MTASHIIRQELDHPERGKQTALKSELRTIRGRNVAHFDVRQVYKENSVIALVKSRYSLLHSIVNTTVLT